MSVLPLSINSDEVEIQVQGGYVGLSLADDKYKESMRVRIDAIKPDAESSVVSNVERGFILVSVNGASVEGLSRVRVAEKIRDASRPMRLGFRNPKLFNMQLNSSINGDIAMLSTQVLPASNQNGGRLPQIIRVTRLSIPPASSQLRSRVAGIGDVVEIVYESFDSDGVKVGGMKDVSSDEACAFLVLGSDATPQFYQRPPPPTLERKSTPLNDDELSGDEFGDKQTKLPKIAQQLMVGMCCGETRKIEIPAVLQEGQTDSSRPNSCILVRMLSINGEI
jgi:hypothetical protein